MLYSSIPGIADAKPDQGARGGQLTRTTRRTVKTVATATGLQESLTNARLNYRAGEPSKFRTTLLQLGGTADAHYAQNQRFWQIREYVRDYDRNTPILGQLVDRALDQVLECGLRVDPQTEDPAFNAEALKLWDAWAGDAEACDFSWRQDLNGMERLMLRHAFIDGDTFAILDDDSGKVLILEGDRVDSSSGQRVVTARSGEPIADLVHGVEIDAASRPLAYWFRRQRIGERQLRRRQFGTTSSDQMLRVMREAVVHLFDPKRITQSRGISAFVSVFDRVSMHEDVEFAQLVQQQVAACIAAFITTDQNQQWGSRTTETGNDNETEIEFDEFQPGMVTRLKPGEKIDTFSPRNPTSDARQLAMQIVREIGLAIGLPLELSMLITSDTTFHGYRGVVTAYARTARRQQEWVGKTFRSRVYRWKMRQWIAAGLLTPPLSVSDPTKHVVRAPSSRYVDPLKDATGDKVRQDELLESPRQIAAERGRAYDDIVSETVADRAAMIEAAMAEAERIGVTWQEILGQAPPEAPPPQEPPETE